MSGCWLANARRVATANWDERPAGTRVDLLVIHGISLPPGEFGGPWIEALFQNTLDQTAHPSFLGLGKGRVSAHLLIRRCGTLLQFVDLERRAWHAGYSSFQGRLACNDFSIGIELEGTDDVPYEDAQYLALADATKEIQWHYPAIDRGRIVGHCHIAPGRKTDPGPAFDWGYYHHLLASY